MISLTTSTEDDELSAPILCGWRSCMLISRADALTPRGVRANSYTRIEGCSAVFAQWMIVRFAL